MEISKKTLKLIQDFTRKAYDTEFIDMLDSISPQMSPSIPTPICKYGDTPIYSRARYFELLNAIFS